MCIICKDLDLGRLTPWEAANNAFEMESVLEEEHLEVLGLKIQEAIFNFLEEAREEND